MDSFLLPTGYNHMFMVQKVGRGFEYHGFKTKIVNKISEIGEPGFVMICNHPVYFSLGSRHNKNGNILRVIPALIRKADKAHLVESTSTILRHTALKRLAKQIKDKNVVVIAWNCQGDKKLIDELGMRTIFTNDYYNGMPLLKEHVEWYRLLKEKRNKNFMPLKFAADVNPDTIGNGCKNNKYIVSYVGDKGYMPEYRAAFVDNSRCKIVPTPPYISEDEKIDIYRNSMIVLGLSSTMNKKEKMVSERIFEALAFGCICLTDHPYAPKMTNGTAIYVKNADELKAKVDLFAKNRDTRMKQRKMGLEFTKKYGTWASRAKDFINLANKLYKINLK